MESNTESGLRDSAFPWRRRTLEGIKDEPACGTYNVYVIPVELNRLVKIPHAWSQRTILYVEIKPCITV